MASTQSEARKSAGAKAAKGAAKAAAPKQPAAKKVDEPKKSASNSAAKKAAAPKSASNSAAKKASTSKKSAAPKNAAAKGGSAKKTPAKKAAAPKKPAAKKSAAKKRAKGIEENPVALRSSGFAQSAAWDAYDAYDAYDAFDAYDNPPPKPKRASASRSEAAGKGGASSRREAAGKGCTASRRKATGEGGAVASRQVASGKGNATASGRNTSSKGGASAKSGKAKPAPKGASSDWMELGGEFDPMSGPEKSGARGGRQAAAHSGRSSNSGKSGGSGRRRGRGFGLVNLVLLMAVLGLAGIGVWRTMEYRALAEMKAVVSRQTFYPGTTVDGVDVSDMTLESALEYWNRQIEPTYRQAAVTLDDGTRVTALELGYASNYEAVLSSAWNTGRSGSLRQRYLRASTGSGRAYRVERVNYDDNLVRSYAAALAAQVDADPQDARLTGFDPDSHEFTFTDASEGHKLDQEALVNAVESALNAGGGKISRKIATIEPAVSQADVSSEYGMITSAVTNAESSSSNRLSNIRLAVSMINGTRLRPGEQFSFNETVGERTTARGFKLATAYSSGTVTEEVGGGICQVSTTLFNAAVKADLRIDERHPHSLTVSYVDLGKDAAVDWGGKDLKFTNTSDGDVYIACTVTDDKRIRFGVFGRLLPNGETITVEGVKTGDVDFKTQYQLSFELLSGQTRRLQKGKKGSTATAYKIRWDAEGNEISREVLCKSRYSATPEIVEYGP